MLIRCITLIFKPRENWLGRFTQLTSPYRVHSKLWFALKRQKYFWYGVKITFSKKLCLQFPRATKPSLIPTSRFFSGLRHHCVNLRQYARESEQLCSCASVCLRACGSECWCLSDRAFVCLWQCVCAFVRPNICTSVCVGVRQCAAVCVGVRWCALVWVGVSWCAFVHQCALVRQCEFVRQCVFVRQCAFVHQRDFLRRRAAHTDNVSLLEANAWWRYC